MGRYRIYLDRGSSIENAPDLHEKYGGIRYQKGTPSPENPGKHPADRVF